MRKGLIDELFFVVAANNKSTANNIGNSSVYRQRNPSLLGRRFRPAHPAGRNSQVLVRPFGRDATTGRSNQQTVAQQVRLVRVLDGRGLFTTGVGQSRESDRLIGELIDRASRIRRSNLSRPNSSTPKSASASTRHVVVHDVVALHRGEVANSAQQAVGDSRRAAAAPGDDRGRLALQGHVRAGRPNG